MTPKFKRGDRVRKKGDKGQWHGVICGDYSSVLTDVTPEGYAVESEREEGSVQIYPASALEMVEEKEVCYKAHNDPMRAIDELIQEMRETRHAKFAHKLKTIKVALTAKPECLDIDIEDLNIIVTYTGNNKDDIRKFIGALNACGYKIMKPPQNKGLEDG